MKITSVLAFTFGAMTTAMVGAFVLPSNTKEAIVHEWRRFNSDPGQACFDFEREQLKDPYSAVLDSYSKSPEKFAVVIVKYHAKNAYGAYGPGEAQCVVSDGKVSEDLTRLHRMSVESRKSTAKHEERIICLRKELALIQQGHPRDPDMCPEVSDD